MLHFETGKYGFYIWTAYGLSALVFVALIASSLGHARRWKQRAQAQARQ